MHAHRRAMIASMVAACILIFMRETLNVPFITKSTLEEPFAEEVETFSPAAAVSISTTSVTPPPLQLKKHMELIEIAKAVRRGKGSPLHPWRLEEVPMNRYLEPVNNSTLPVVERIVHLSSREGDEEERHILMIWIWLNSTAATKCADNTIVGPRTFFPFLQPRVEGPVTFGLKWDLPKNEDEADESKECLLLFAARFVLPEAGIYRLSTHLTHQAVPLRIRSGHNSVCWVPQEIINDTYSFESAATNATTSPIITSPSTVYWKLPAEYLAVLRPPVNVKYTNTTLHMDQKLWNRTSYRFSDGRYFNRTRCREEVVVPRLAQFTYDPKYKSRFSRVTPSASPTSNSTSVRSDSGGVRLPSTPSPTTAEQYTPWTLLTPNPTNYTTLWLPHLPTTKRSHVCFLGDSHLRYYANEIHTYFFAPLRPQRYAQTQRYHVPNIPDFSFIFIKLGAGEIVHFIRNTTFPEVCTEIFVNFGLWSLMERNNVREYEAMVESSLRHLLATFPHANQLHWVATEPCPSYTRAAHLNSASCPGYDLRNAAMILKFNTLAREVIARLRNSSDGEVGKSAQRVGLDFLDLAVTYNGLELMVYDDCHFIFPMANPAVDRILGLLFPECVEEGDKWTYPGEYVKYSPMAKKDNYYY